MAFYISNYPEIISALFMQSAIGFPIEKNHRIDLEFTVLRTEVHECFFHFYKLVKLLIKHARFLTSSPK